MLAVVGTVAAGQSAFFFCALLLISPRAPVSLAK